MGTISPSYCSYVACLTTSSQFSRLWVVQEVGTDSPVIFHWGSASIEFEKLYAAAGELQRHLFMFAHDRHIHYTSPFTAYKSFVETHENNHQYYSDFVFTLREFNRSRDCRDPRDCVFARKYSSGPSFISFLFFLLGCEYCLNGE